jgi:hypothetical protein
MRPLDKVRCARALEHDRTFANATIGASGSPACEAHAAIEKPREIAAGGRAGA